MNRYLSKYLKTLLDALILLLDSVHAGKVSTDIRGSVRLATADKAFRSNQDKSTSFEHDLDLLLPGLGKPNHPESTVADTDVFLGWVKVVDRADPDLGFRGARGRGDSGRSGGGVDARARLLSNHSMRSGSRADRRLIRIIFIAVVVAQVNKDVLLLDIVLHQKIQLVSLKPVTLRGGKYEPL